jgi:hypothetical protein
LVGTMGRDFVTIIVPSWHRHGDFFDAKMACKPIAGACGTTR